MYKQNMGSWKEKPFQIGYLDSVTKKKKKKQLEGKMLKVTSYL